MTNTVDHPHVHFWALRAAISACLSSAKVLTLIPVAPWTRTFTPSAAGSIQTRFLPSAGMPAEDLAACSHVPAGIRGTGAAAPGGPSKFGSGTLALLALPPPSYGRTSLPSYLSPGL
jgi:hypothetical protein